MFITYKCVLSNKPFTASEAYQKLLKLKQYSGSFPRGGAFEQLFGRGGRSLNNIFPKIQMLGGLPGGMSKLLFDWYISGEI